MIIYPGRPAIHLKIFKINEYTPFSADIYSMGIYNICARVNVPRMIIMIILFILLSTLSARIIQSFLLRYTFGKESLCPALKMLVYLYPDRGLSKV